MLSVPSLVRIHFAKCISCWVIKVPLPNCFSADFVLWLNQYLFSVQNFCPALHSSSQVQCGTVLLIINPWIKTGESKQITLEGSRHPHSRRGGHRPEVCSVRRREPWSGWGVERSKVGPPCLPVLVHICLKTRWMMERSGEIRWFLKPSEGRFVNNPIIHHFPAVLRLAPFLFWFFAGQQSRAEP